MAGQRVASSRVRPALPDTERFSPLAVPHLDG